MGMMIAENIVMIGSYSVFASAHLHLHLHSHSHLNISTSRLVHINMNVHVQTYIHIYTHLATSSSMSMHTYACPYTYLYSYCYICPYLFTASSMSITITIFVHTCLYACLHTSSSSLSGIIYSLSNPRPHVMLKHINVYICKSKVSCVYYLPSILLLHNHFLQYL